MIFDKKEHARHTLFCGTKVIQTRYIGSEKVLAIVINTGNITAKGGLIRSILYPPPVDYKFEQDSYKFIEFLGLIALIGFIYTLVSKVSVCVFFYVSLAKGFEILHVFHGGIKYNQKMTLCTKRFSCLNNIFIYNFWVLR